MAETATVSFQFGSVVLSNVLTREYREEVQTDPSRVNITTVKHRITVQGTLAGGLPPAESGEGPGDVMAGLRRYLLRHRRYLCYAIAGKKVVEVGSSSSPDNPALNKDAANGPRCLWVNAVSIADGCVVVEVAVEAELVPCDVQSRAILSHRFSQREDYDAAGYCTLTTQGLIVTRSDIERTPTQILEGAGLPKIRDGYTRKGKSFTLMDDGVRFLYQIVDQEHHRRPPEGVVEADGSFTVVTGATGSGAYANVTIRLRGFKEVTKQQLYEKAAAIYLAKTLSIRAVDEKGQPSKVSVRASEELYKNVIELQFEVLADEKKLTVGRDGRGRFRSEIFGGDGGNFRPGGPSVPGLPVPVNPGQADGAREEVLRDGQLVDMLRSALQEPCESLAVVRQPSGRGTARSGTAAALAGQLGDATATPGPVAGGGSIGTFTPEQVDAILGGNARTIAGAFGVELPGVQFNAAEAFPADGREPSLTERYFPDAGGAATPPNNEFGAFGSNDVQSRRPATFDPPDVGLPYTSYLVTIDHELDTGKRVAAGCGPRDPKTGRMPKAPVAAVHNPTLTVHVAWTAERYGAPPQIPDPCAGDPNVVLIRKRITTEQPRRIPSGELRYAVSGRYDYGIREPELFPILEAFPPFLLQDVMADIRAGIESGDSAPSMAKNILWLRMKTAPPAKFFGPCETPEETVPRELRGAAPSEGLAGLLGDVQPSALELAASVAALASGAVPPYNPNPGG